MDGDRSPQPGPSACDDNDDDEVSEEDTEDETYVSPFADFGEEFFEHFNHEEFLGGFNVLKETASKNVDKKLADFFGESYDLDAVVGLVLGDDEDDEFECDSSESDGETSYFDREDTSLSESESSSKTAHGSKEESEDEEEEEWITDESFNTSKTESDVVRPENCSSNGESNDDFDQQLSVSQCEPPSVNKPSDNQNEFELSDIADKEVSNYSLNIKIEDVNNETDVKPEVEETFLTKHHTGSTELELSCNPASDVYAAVDNCKSDAENLLAAEKSNDGDELESPESPPPNDRECNSLLTCREIPTVNLNESADSNLAVCSVQPSYNEQQHEPVCYPPYVHQWGNYMPNQSGFSDHNQLSGSSKYHNDAGFFPLGSAHMNNLGTSLYCGISNSDPTNKQASNHYLQSSPNVWPGQQIMNQFGNNWLNGFGSTNNFSVPQSNQTTYMNCGIDQKVNCKSNGVGLFSPESPSPDHQGNYGPLHNAPLLLNSDCKKLAEHFDMWQNAQYNKPWSRNQSAVLNMNTEQSQPWAADFNSEAQTNTTGNEANLIKTEIVDSFPKEAIDKPNEVSRKENRTLNDPITSSTNVTGSNAESHSSKIEINKFNDCLDENSKGNIRELIIPKIEAKQDTDYRISFPQLNKSLPVMESPLFMVSSEPCDYNEARKTSSANADESTKHLHDLLSLIKKNHNLKESSVDTLVKRDSLTTKLGENEIESNNKSSPNSMNESNDHSKKESLVDKQNIRPEPDSYKCAPKDVKDGEFNENTLNSMKLNQDSDTGQLNSSISSIKSSTGKKKSKEQNKEKHEKKKSAKKENKIKSSPNKFKEDSESSLPTLSLSAKLQDKKFNSAKKLQKYSDSNSPIGFCDKTNINKRICLKTKDYKRDRYSISPKPKISKSTKFSHSKGEDGFSWNNELRNHNEEDSTSPRERFEDLTDRSDYSSKSNKLKGRTLSTENVTLHDENVENDGKSNHHKSRHPLNDDINHSKRFYKRFKKKDKSPSRYSGERRHITDKYWKRKDIQKDIECFERNRMKHKQKFGDCNNKDKREFYQGSIHRKRSRSRSFNEDSRIERSGSSVSSGETHSKKDITNSHKYKDKFYGAKNIPRSVGSKNKISRDRVRSPTSDSGFHKRKLKDRSLSPVKNSKHDYRRKSRDKSLSPAVRSQKFHRTKSRDLKLSPEKEIKNPCEKSVVSPPPNNCLVSPVIQVCPQGPTFSSNEASQYTPTWQGNSWTPFTSSDPNSYSGYVPPMTNVVPQNQWTHQGDQSFQPGLYYNHPQQYFYS